MPILTWPVNDPSGSYPLYPEITMDNYHQAQKGGFVPLLVEAVPDLSASAAVFANAPAGTVAAEVSVQSKDLIVRWNVRTRATGAWSANAASTAAGGGNVYPAGGNYWLPYSQDVLLKANAIQSAATLSGTITYWGLA